MLDKPSNDTSFSRRAGLDGSRGLYAMMVVLFHLKLPFFSQGYVGVDAFFVLSGFVITSILLHEIGNTGKVDFVRFYSRRFKRLLPSSLLVLLVTVILYSLLFPPLFVARARNSFLAASTFWENINLIIESKDYFAADVAEQTPVMHYWSLSIEEQFYFVYPCVLFLLVKTRFSRSLTIIIFTITSTFLLIWEFNGVITHLASTSEIYFGTIYRVYQLLSGCTIGMIVYQYEKQGYTVSSSKPLGDWTGMAGEIMTIFGLFSMCILSTSLIPMNSAVLGFISTVVSVIILVGTEFQPNSISDKILSTSAMQFLGRHSYSIYLWHYPVIILGKVNQRPLFQLGAVVITILLSVLSSYLENPIRKTKLSNKTVVMIGVLAVILSFTFIAVYTNNFDGDDTADEIVLDHHIMENLNLQMDTTQYRNEIENQSENDPVKNHTTNKPPETSENDIKSDNTNDILETSENLNTTLSMNTTQSDTNYELIQPKYYMIGDSMTHQWYDGFEIFNEQYPEFAFELKFNPGKVFFLDVQWIQTKSHIRVDCAPIHRATLNILQQDDIPKVVMFASYSAMRHYIPANSNHYHVDLYPGSKKWQSFIDEKLRETIEPYLNHTRVILFNCLTVRNPDMERCEQKNDPLTCNNFPVTMDEFAEPYTEIYLNLTRDYPGKVDYISSADIICPNGYCNATINGLPLWLNENHIFRQRTPSLMGRLMEYLLPHLHKVKWDPINKVIID